MEHIGFSDDGIMRCSRYAFGPNRLHYCGPTASGASNELLARQKAGEVVGTGELLRKFETLFPYLSHIAGENSIRDPFDSRVVEAYWIGNDLLRKIEQGQFYRYLKDGLGVKKKIGAEVFESGIAEKIRAGGVPHHSFHVLNIWRRTSHADIAHTVESMGECLVSVGTVTLIDGPWITVATEQLTFDGKSLLFVPEMRRLPQPFDASEEWDMLALGDSVSFHWGVMCEVLTPAQAANLKKYTAKSVELANEHFL